ncbi:MAG: hypothetical protein NTU83_02095 [Candidatus Hydrogenedentes bacterium]|nr:hypothetical protein [Candidatus Hydrogenedentota bacterium]
MDNNVARELLRYAMAYREKAQAAALGGDDEHATRAMAEAQDCLTRVRVALMADLELRATELRAAIESPADGMDVSLLRGNVSAFNDLLRAKRADQLGHFIDLPLEEYPARIRACAETLGIWPSRHASRQRRRYTIAGIDVMPTRRGFIAWLICLGAALLASGYYLGVMRPFSELGVTASPVDVRGNVQVTCRHDRMSAVPDTPDTLPASSSTDYALAIYAREKAGDAYRLLPPVPNAWTYLGVVLQETAPIAIGPSLACELTFSPARVREATGASFTRLRLVLARAGHATTAACEFDVPPAPGR